MVKIKRDSHEIKVSKKSFKNVFEPLGYTLVGENKKKEKPEIKVEKAEPVKKTEEVVEKFDIKGKGKKQED